MGCLRAAFGNGAGQFPCARFGALGLCLKPQCKRIRFREMTQAMFEPVAYRNQLRFGFHAMFPHHGPYFGYTGIRHLKFRGVNEN